MTYQSLFPLNFYLKFFKSQWYTSENLSIILMNKPHCYISLGLPLIFSEIKNFWPEKKRLVCNVKTILNDLSLKLLNFVFSFTKIAEAYSELCQTSKMERFTEIVNGFQPFTIFAKISIVDV